MNKSLLIPMLLLIPVLPAQAQFGTSKVATVTAAARSTSVVRGGKGVLLVTVNIGPKYHINANQPNDPAYIATVFSGQAAPGITFGPAKYPLAKSIKVSYSPKPLLVYRGKAIITVPFTVSKNAKTGQAALRGSVAFQGCDAQSCYPPTTAPVTAMVVVR